MASTSDTGSPCGGCKYLRRKCVADCVFAPYFCCEQGPATFAAIHKVFGASNLSKLLLHVPVHHRCDAVFTIAYEAHARIHDPVYGCVAHLFALQQQVAYLQTQVMQAKAKLAQTLIESRGKNMEIEWTRNFNFNFNNNNNNNIPTTSLYQNYYQSPIMNTELCANKDEVLSINFQDSQTTSPNDVGDLQALAFRMMRN